MGGQLQPFGSGTRDMGRDQIKRRLRVLRDKFQIIDPGVNKRQGTPTTFGQVTTRTAVDAPNELILNWKTVRAEKDASGHPDDPDHRLRGTHVNVPTGRDPPA